MKTLVLILIIAVVLIAGLMFCGANEPAPTFKDTVCPKWKQKEDAGKPHCPYCKYKEKK